MVKEGEYGANTVYTMNVNGKTISVETIPGMEEGGMTENGGEGKFEYDIVDVV
jgi:hypothetical protein